MECVFLDGELNARLRPPFRVYFLFTLFSFIVLFSSRSKLHSKENDQHLGCLERISSEFKSFFYNLQTIGTDWRTWPLFSMKIKEVLLNKIKMVKWAGEKSKEGKEIQPKIHRYFYQSHRLAAYPPAYHGAVDLGGLFMDSSCHVMFSNGLFSTYIL